MNHSFIRVILVLFALPFAAVSQNVQLTGVVNDQDGKSIPFVTVYIEGSTNGTTTNANGAYILSLSPGYHTVVFRSMGYATLIKPTQVDGNLEMNVTIQPQSYRLKEVQVDGNEDPADRIMRLARGKRKFYQRQIDEYACKVYIKGINYIKNAPKRILGQDINIDGLDKTRSGIVYLSESVSELYYKAPDKTTERVIASKVSGNSQGFTWNNATSIQFNFYDRSYNLEGLSDRDLVSPLSPNARLYYRFKYKGFFMEDSLIINKIKVIPKVKGVPLFKGYLLIQENTWRVHGADMFMTKDAGIDFVDTVKMKVDFVPINEDVWLKKSLTFDLSFNVKLVGIKGWGSYSSVYSDYEIGSFVPEPKEIRLDVSEEELAIDSAERERPREKSESRNDFEKLIEASADSTEQKDQMKDLIGKYSDVKRGPLIKVESEANEMNEAFWDSVRVIPLTEVEALDYDRKDSLELVRDTDVYKDSLDKENNKFKIGDLVFGYQYSHRKKRLQLELPSLLTVMNFNPVEGYNFTLDPRLSYMDDKNRRIMSAQISARYGLASARFYLKGSLVRHLNRYWRSSVRVEGGQYIEQFSNGSIKESINSLYSVLWETSHLRVYRHSYGKASWGRELFNGFKVRLEGYYGKRDPLRNSTDLKNQFIESESRSFKSNDELNEDVDSRPALISSHTAATSTIRVSYQPGAQYIEHPDRKLSLGSKYPHFRLQYTKGWAGIMGSETNFDHVALTIRDDHNLGMIGRLEWRVGAGYFINKAFVPFADRQHFNTSLTLLAKNGLSSFRGLPYYHASTDQYHVEGHVEQHFHGFVLNKIPLIKKLKWQTVGGFHYLYQPNFGHFYEATVGIENIFKVLRADVAFPFHNHKYQGVKVTVSLPF
ncbi:MAG: hypothetical protein ACI9FU_000617 [Granulosicoccus sp.]